MKILVTGNNSDGQLQTESANDEMLEIKLHFTVKKVACGYYHVLILTDNNELYGCGQNSQGQLGIKDTSNVYKLTKITIPKLNSEIKAISCGGYYSTLFTKDNSLFVTGQGTCGQLGFGNSKQLNEFTKNNFNFGRIKCVKCCGGTTIVFNENGNFYFSGCRLEGAGNYIFNFKQFYCNSDIIDFLCGYNHVIMLDKFGKIFKATSTGVNQLIIPFNIIGNVKQIGSSYYHYFILNDKNELYFYVNNTSKEGVIDLKSYNNIKLYSGLSTKLFFTHTCCNNGGEKVGSIILGETTTDVKELVFKGQEQERYLFPITGYEFAYIINSNNSNWFEDKESKEVERMVNLLLKQLQQQHNEQFNKSFRDVTFIL